MIILIGVSKVNESVLHSLTPNYPQQRILFLHRVYLKQGEQAMFVVITLKRVNEFEVKC